MRDLAIMEGCRDSEFFVPLLGNLITAVSNDVT